MIRMGLASLAFLIAAVTPMEAHVSMISETVDLETVVKSTTHILIANPHEAGKLTGSQPAYQFSYIRTLMGKTDLKPKQIFPVHPANFELHRQIAEAQKRGEPTPIPIVSLYGTTLENMTSAKEVILFMTLTSKSQFQLTMEGGYESIKMLSAVERLIKKHQR